MKYQESFTGGTVNASGTVASVMPLQDTVPDPGHETETVVTGRSLLQRSGMIKTLNHTSLKGFNESVRKEEITY